MAVTSHKIEKSCEFPRRRLDAFLIPEIVELSLPKLEIRALGPRP